MPKDYCVRCKDKIDTQFYEERGNYCAECCSDAEKKKYVNYVGPNGHPKVKENRLAKELLV